MQRLAITRTGLPGIPELSWGAHLCLFYETRSDLVEILAPFAIAGIENREACFLFAYEEESMQQLEHSLRLAFADYDERVANGQIEIVRLPPGTYLPDGPFDAQRSTDFWREKTRIALERGFVGLRVSGAEVELAHAEWADFEAYEERLGTAVAGDPIVVLCPYDLNKLKGADIFQLAQWHRIVLAKRGGKWEALEAADLDQPRKHLQAMRAELEWRVLQATEKLSAANERLRREIADRTRVERALRESEARFRVAFDVTPVMGAISRMEDSRFLDANQAFLRTFGYTRAEVVGRTAAELGLWVNPEQREQVIETIRRHGSMLNYPAQLRTKSGRIIDFLGVAVATDVDGEQCAIIGGLDMTARNRAEKRLLEQQWLLNESERLTGTGSWHWAIDSGHVVWSRELYRLHGQDPESFQPTYESWLELVHPEDRVALAASIKAAREGHASFSVEHRIVRPDGAVRLIRSVGHYSADAAEGARIIGYAMDITEKRDGEQKTRIAAAQLAAMSRKLVQVEEAERRHLASELHDRVGQNLTAISLSMDSIAKQVASLDGAEARVQVLARLEDCAALLESTLDAVADVAAEMRPPMLDDLGLEAALKWYARLFTDRTGIEVRYHGEADPRMPADRELAAFRIVQEALMNVAKHAQAHVVDLRFEHDARECRIVVCDDGVGPASTSTGRSDQGLGLITMRERALAVGGSFEFGPRAGGGTCVTLRLPVSVQR